MKKRRELIERIEEKLTIRKKSSAHTGLGFIILLTILLHAFLLLRGSGNMEFA